MADDAGPGKYLEKRAHQLGLPTDPAAYQDGGLAVAEVAPDLQQAELIAGVLRGADVPAWVEGSHMAAWNWHMQLALHPRGIRVLVPQGRLEEARAALRQARQDGAQYRAEEPAEDSAPDPGYPYYRSAQRMAYLLLIGLIAPIVFILALRLLVRIRRQRKMLGLTRDLARARRLGILIAVLACPVWGLFLGAIGIAIVWGVAD